MCYVTRLRKLGRVTILTRAATCCHETNIMTVTRGTNCILVVTASDRLVVMAGRGMASGTDIIGVGASASVEQHRSDRQVEADACHFLGRSPVQSRRQLGPAVASADREVAPTAVRGHLEVRIVGGDGLGDVVGRGLEALRTQREVIQLIVPRGGQHHGAAFANRLRRTQPSDRRVGITQVCHAYTKGP